MLTLNCDNYHSIEANKEYMSNSQWASWMDCAAATKAEQDGLYVKEQTDAMFISSYYDRALTAPDEFEAYCLKHRDKIFKEVGKKGEKTWEKRADFETADTIIAVIKADPAYQQLVANCKMQEIMTGEIGGVPFRYMADFTMHGGRAAVLDLKCMANFEPVYVESCRRKIEWIDAWGYLRQLSIGRRLYRQRYNINPIMGILATTKQEIPDRRTYIFEDEERAENEIQHIIEMLPTVLSWKSGAVEPPACGTCAYCRSKSSFSVERLAVSARRFTE